MTTKLNKAAYDRMVAQAEEAKRLGLEKLANGVFEAVGSFPREEVIEYNSDELANDTYKALWKAACDIIAYHDLKTVDIQRVDELVEHLNAVVITAMETHLGVMGQVGKLEGKLPGETK